MMCPKCGSENYQLCNQSAQAEEEKYRQCQKCDHRWRENDWFGSMFESNQEEREDKKKRF